LIEFTRLKILSIFTVADETFGIIARTCSHNYCTWIFFHFCKRYCYWLFFCDKVLL